MHSRPHWIDKHFWQIVPILAFIGCIRGSFYTDSALGLFFTIIPFICGSIGCYLWALYLRKSSQGIWLILGLIPALPVLYLLGWHRAYSKAKLDFGPLPVDCPRCGMLIAKSGRCPNCNWHQERTEQ